MVVRVVPLERLPDDELSVWARHQQENPELGSPFFRPEFAGAVAAARGGVEVAVVDGEEGPAFLPFQRAGRRRGLPVGSRLSDYQGVVAGKGQRVDLRDVVRAAGLRSFEFDGLIASQAAPGAHWLPRESRFLDLSSGLDSYLRTRREAGTDQLDDALKQRGRLERALGEVTFERESSDRALLETLLAWKSDQYRRTGAVDVFAFPWVRDAVRRVHDAQTPHFAGLLSTLHAGERLVAAHLGLRSGTVWHYWFPAYDPAQRRYSPGLVLLLEMARAAAEHGLRAIDLGKGDALYKRRLTGVSAPLVAGTLRVSPAAAAAGAAERALLRVVHRTPLSGPFRRRATRRRFA